MLLLFPWPHFSLYNQNIGAWTHRDTHQAMHTYIKPYAYRRILYFCICVYVCIYVFNQFKMFHSHKRVRNCIWSDMRTSFGAHKPCWVFRSFCYTNQCFYCECYLNLYWSVNYHCMWQMRIVICMAINLIWLDLKTNCNIYTTIVIFNTYCYWHTPWCCCIIVTRIQMLYLAWLYLCISCLNICMDHPRICWMTMEQDESLDARKIVTRTRNECPPFLPTCKRHYAW